MATPTTQTASHRTGAGGLSAGIAGASGYAGRELARLIAGHPQLSLRTAQARSEGFDVLSPEELARCDVAFLALPHGSSRAFGTALAAAGTPVVDLGSDFRLDSDWAYGLTELFRQDVLDSRQIANPGCYATAATLALAPLAEAGLLDAPVAIDGKSGISGAGREPTELTHVSEIEGGVQPYKPTGHRHIAEIERSLARLAGEAVPVTFTPHYAPHSRGLEVTCYARLRRPVAQPAADALYHARYDAEPFVSVEQRVHPGRLHGANSCHVGIWIDERTQTAICAAALDNLVKGAAGQAIQNANLALGLDEGAGLTALGLGV
ncbi:MAG TPA: N-acetyl-gamma-glutamyl-phosphate reductase [Gaiellales bacterium]|jgi:N-acetyl-gamma-glutamyl-phosphate reductase|nr:N-acetyl-gamma-glutamyl-phosphate reductase [Gaiellales bacterium]